MAIKRRSATRVGRVTAPKATTVDPIRKYASIITSIKRQMKDSITASDIQQLETFIRGSASLIDILGLGDGVATCSCQSVCGCKDQCTNECNSQCSCKGVCTCKTQCPCKDVDKASQFEMVSQPPMEVWDLIRLYPGINVIKDMVIKP